MSALSQLKIKALLAFDNIGKKNGTAPLPSSENRYALAHEYFIASALASYASKRKDIAKIACEKAGMLGEEFIPGETIETYDSEHLSIIAKTAQPAERIDRASLRTELVKLLGEKVADEVIKKATKTNKAATSYDFITK